MSIPGLSFAGNDMPPLPRMYEEYYGPSLKELASKHGVTIALRADIEEFCKGREVNCRFGNKSAVTDPDQISIYTTSQTGAEVLLGGFSLRTALKTSDIIQDPNITSDTVTATRNGRSVNVGASANSLFEKLH